MNQLKLWTPKPALLRSIGLRNPLTLIKLGNDDWNNERNILSRYFERPFMDGKLYYTFTLPKAVFQHRPVYGEMSWRIENVVQTWSRQQRSLDLDFTIRELLEECGYKRSERGFNSDRIGQADGILKTWLYVTITYDGSKGKRFLFYAMPLLSYLKIEGRGERSKVHLVLNERLFGDPKELQYVKLSPHFLEDTTTFEKHILVYVNSLQNLKYNEIKVRKLLNEHCYLPDEVVIKMGGKRIKEKLEEALEKAITRKGLVKYKYREKGDFLNWILRLWPVKKLSALELSKESKRLNEEAWERQKKLDRMSKTDLVTEQIRENRKQAEKEKARKKLTPGAEKFRRQLRKKYLGEPDV